MIHPEPEENIKQESVKLPSDDVSTKEVKIKASVRGFLVNILLALFWWAVFGLSCALLSDFDIVTRFLVSIITFSGTLLLSSFHVYVLFKPGYEYTEEDEELSLADFFKKRWALASGTAIFFLAFNAIFANALARDISKGKEISSEDALIGMIVLLFINAVAGMNCWGFVTNNKKNIFARIVRPWQVYDDTKAETETEQV